MDCCDLGIFDTVEERIKHKFVDAGMKTKWKQPYEIPHLLFWNLRKTTGFPATSYSKNIAFLSGYSSTLLNVFCKKGIEALRECAPVSMLRDMLRSFIIDYLSLKKFLKKKIKKTLLII